MKLLIVESPGKTKKIQEILGQEWCVRASVGHIRDLPQKELGVSLETFKVTYEPYPRSKRIIDELRAKAKQADEVYLATDPDREGEAIAWHLQEVLKLKKCHRATFSEITEKAVKNAVASPRELDQNLISAQEARRVLDRLFGYRTSWPLSDVIGQRGLSAGRVQSPALRRIVEREMEIRAFNVTTHYGAELIFDCVKNIHPGWKAQWEVESWLEKDQRYILDHGTAEKVAKVKEVQVIDLEESEGKTPPPPPFITSTLQQAASNVLNLSAKETMRFAQKLYEAGHITYMRTDYPNLSEKALAEIHEYCRANGLPLHSPARVWKSKAGAQEAHDAIRPTHIEVEEAGETGTEKALYKLIRIRTLASQLEDAKFKIRKARLHGDVQGKVAAFVASGKTLLSPGWTILLGSDESVESDPEPSNPVPKLQSGATLSVKEGIVVTCKTKPPKRYSEADLIRKLESDGIGRPSTYAAIIDGLLNKKYVRPENKHLVPTPTGEEVIEALAPHFSFLDYAYTREMEAQLDSIARGQANYFDLVKQSNKRLDAELLAFKADTSPKCPECGKFMHKITLKGQTPFWGCEGYPDCKFTASDDNGKLGQQSQSTKSELSNQHFCPDCGKPLTHKVKSGDKGFNFWGCSGFPKCKVTYDDDNGKPKA